MNCQIDPSTALKETILTTHYSLLNSHYVLRLMSFRSLLWGFILIFGWVETYISEYLRTKVMLNYNIKTVVFVKNDVSFVH